jgi:hypothetical protein
MFHTSPNKIELGMINNHGVAGSCLFFSDRVYIMTASSTVYVYEAEFNCIRASQLYDEETISRIAEYFYCDKELAESLLDGSHQAFDCDAEASWWLQGQRGECAVKMGYDGCKDEDEQGAVYIIPMIGRESELTLVKVIE